jgi:integrase
MRWEDISEDGVWTVPTAPREKGTAGDLRLPPVALEILKAQPRHERQPYVLPGGASFFTGFSQAKLVVDRSVKIAPWTIHDLRRTSRSLLARAGVRPDVAERVMGHAIQGVEGVYDRHAYTAEKADALRRLANLIKTIVEPPVGNVVPLVAAQ